MELWHGLKGVLAKFLDEVVRLVDGLYEILVYRLNWMSHSENRLNTLAEKDDHHIDLWTQWQVVIHKVSETGVSILSEIKSDWTTVLDRTAPFLEICLQEYVNKASESLIVMFLSQGEVPAEVVCLILNANVFSAEHDTFNYGINFCWR